MLKRAYDKVTPPAPETGDHALPPSDASQTFHDEMESKFLVEKQPGQKFHTRSDAYVFNFIQGYFKSKGWMLAPHRTGHLLTRQFDTKDTSLVRAKGDTLRMRANCIANNLRKIDTVDICVKLTKEITPSGALKRPEFEARTPDFYKVDFSPLKKRYADKSDPNHKKLHDLLDTVKEEDLIEYFRIDVKRRRLLVELPEEETGLKGKRFVAEVLLDDVAHVIDIRDDGSAEPKDESRAVVDYPYVFNHDLEVEAEVLYKPCEYNKFPGSDEMVTSPDMSAEEVDHCMTVLKKHLKAAARGKIRENSLSKAERGFIALGIISGPEKAAEQDNNPSVTGKGRLIDAFQPSAKGRLVPAENSDILPRTPDVNVIGYRRVAHRHHKNG